MTDIRTLHFAAIDGAVASRRRARRAGRHLREEKEQSAIEYLFTYGWAILIIAVVLGVFFQLGVFSSLTLGPRAPPGSCQVIRSTAFTTLQGLCSGILPEFVATLSGVNSGSGGGNGGNSGNQGGGLACVNSTVPSMNTATHGYNTVVFWMNWNGTLNESPVGFPGYFLWLSTNSCIGFSTGNNDAYGVSSNGLANKWVMVAVDYYNGPYTDNSTLYLDGVEQNLYQCLPTAHTGLAKNVLLIGSSTGSKYRFTGSIANVQVYNTSLGSSEIMALYVEGLGGAPIDLPNLVAWFPLNGNGNDYGGYTDNLVYSKCAYTYLSSYGSPT